MLHIEFIYIPVLSECQYKCLTLKMVYVIFLYMTVLEATELLLSWFYKNNSFNIDTEYKKLLPSHISDTPEADMVAVLCALKELRENNIIKSDEIKGKIYYVLTRSLDSIPQNIQLSSSTCLMIAEIASKTCKIMGKTDISINPLNITENDLLIALSITNELNNNKNNNNL